MSFKRFGALCAALLVLGSFGQMAHAGFTWNGTDGAPGPLTPLRISLSNFEYSIDVDGSQGFGAGAIVPLADTAGDEIRGIFVIDSIDNAGSTLNFWKPTATAELTGEFAGYFVKTVGGGGTPVDFTGGFQKIYFDDTPDFDSDFSKVPGVETLGVGHGDKFADGTLFLDLVGEGGAVPGDLTITLSSTILPPGFSISGVGLGFLKIIGGSQAASFFPDSEDPVSPGSTPGSQDLKLVNTITVQSGFPGSPTIWPVTSGDPISATAVPEPSSLVLLGLGALCGIPYLRRRRRQNRIN